MRIGITRASGKKWMNVASGNAVNEAVVY